MTLPEQPTPSISTRLSEPDMKGSTLTNQRSWATSHPGSLALIVVAAFVVICGGVKMAGSILAPTVFGAYVATVNAPFVSWLLRRRFPVTLTVATVLTGDAVLLAGFAGLLIISSAELSERLPQYILLLQSANERVSEWLMRFAPQGSLLDIVEPAAAMTFVAALLGDLAGLLWDLVVALIIAAFLLLRFAKLQDGSEADGLARFEQFKRSAREVNRYIAVKTGTSMATGTLVGAWVGLLGGELPILFGLLAFLLNYIPNLGSIVAAVPAIGLGFLTRGLDHTLLLASGYLLINLVIGNIIEPRVMGRALGLWPLVVLLSVIFWGWLLGPVGAVLSAVLTVVVKLLLLSAEDLRPIGLVLGPRPASLPTELPERNLLEETMPQSKKPPSGNFDS